MLKYLQISVASLALSVFAVAPAVVVVSADVAVAKNDNGKGGGGGNGNRGNGGGAKGKSGDKGKSGAAKAGKSHKSGKGHASKGKSGTSKMEKSLNRFGNKVKNGFGLFGGQKKSTRSAKASGSKGHGAAKKGFDHPSNLGAFNGAKNSSANAKLAHIRNGNFNGPVGLAAAYAVADANYAHAAEDYQMALDTLAANPDLVDALDYVAGYDDAVATVAAFEERPPATEEEELALEAALAASDLETLENASATIDAAEEATVSDVQDALDAEEPDRMALDEAEQNLLGLYKGDPDALDVAEDDDGVTNREKLLDSVNLPTREQVKAALPAEDPEAVPDDETAETLEETDELVEES